MNVLWIGLTGGIATGKSTVSRLLRERGYAVVDADLLAREVVQSGTPAHSEIVREFGQDAILPSGELNRAKIGDLVFKDRAKLETLESILHPRIRELARAKRDALEELGVKVAFYDVPLLFEKEMESLFDHITVVSCSAETQKKRLMARNGFSSEEADRRIASQLALAMKIQRATSVIENDGTPEELANAVDTYLARLPSPH